MTQGEGLGLVVSYAYAFGLLLVVEAIGKRMRWPQFLTRKLVHIGAGMWVWGILALFDTRLGLVPFATFILLNYLFYRYRIFKAMDAVDSSPGTVYFALSITLLFAVFWRPNGPTDRVTVAVAAIMVMTWGDGMASILGQAYGKHSYVLLGHQRTWEGTVAFLVSSIVAVSLTLALLPGSALSPFGNALSEWGALAAAVAVGAVGALTEALSPAGTDNLTVPLATAALLFLLTR